MSDFFESHVGTAPNYTSRKARMIGRVRDCVYQFNFLTRSHLRRWDDEFRKMPRQRILAVGIAVPGREPDIDIVMKEIKHYSRHDVDICIGAMHRGQGKFANITSAMSPFDLDKYDFLLIVDDDISFSPDMLNRLVGFTITADFLVSQPAHVLSSNASYQVTLRKAGSFARETSFVEIGPLTLIRRPAFKDLLPFPDSRWCYGIDIAWSEAARKSGWKMGVIDGAPIKHLRPVAGSYSADEARAEGVDYVAGLNVLRTRAEMLGFQRVVIPS